MVGVLGRVAPLVILLAIVVSPASAEITLINGGVLGSQTIEISGSALDVDVAEIGPYGIIDAYIYEVSPGTTVMVTLSRPNGDTWTGSYGHRISGVTGNVSYSLGSSVTSREYLAIIPADCMFWVGYAADSVSETSGIALIDLPSHSSDACYVQVPYIDSLPITKIHLSTDNGDEIRIVAHYAKTSAVSEHVNQDLNQKSWTEYLSQLLEIATGFLTAILVLFAVFKFVFLDHFVAVLVLFESVTIAYAASQSRGFIPFIQKFWRYNEGLVTFLLKFMSYVLDFFYRIIQALKPI